MANERRLIDSNTLKACIKKRLLNEMIIGWLFSIINTCPTVDAVEVVRCRDCTWYNSEHGCPLYCSGFYKAGKLLPFENDYCSYGERKDGGQAPQREDV